jgi:hypothetical protein
MVRNRCSGVMKRATRRNFFSRILSLMDTIFWAMNDYHLSQSVDIATIMVAVEEDENNRDIDAKDCNCCICHSSNKSTTLQSAMLTYLPILIKAYVCSSFQHGFLVHIGNNYVSVIISADLVIGNGRSNVIFIRRIWPPLTLCIQVVSLARPQSTL